MGRWSRRPPEPPVAIRRGQERIGHRCSLTVGAARLIAGLVPLLGAADAVAQKWNADAGVSSQLEWSSNTSLGEADGAADTIFVVRPHIRLVGEGGQLKFSGFAALNGIAYLSHTQSSRILPEADLAATLEAVPRLLFLEAGLRAFQTSADPFGARQETGSTSENSVNTVVARFAPRIEGMAGEHLRYLVRSDNSWTFEHGDAAALAGTDSVGYFGQHSASIEQDPLPFGWRLEAQRSDTHYRDGTLDPLVLDVARGTVNYAPMPDLRFGVHLGYERTSFDTPGEGGFIYGLNAKWQPSPRTVLSAFEERRFFGTAWRLTFDHRTPAFAWTLLSTRTLETSPQSLFDLPASDNVAGLLDAMFTTRFPDPVERARAVQDFIARQGLPTSTLQPITLQAQRLSVVNLNVATLALIGKRNTLSFSAFHSRTQDALDTTFIPDGGSFTNNSQIGASLALSHQLTPTASLTASTDWSRIRALPGFGDDRTTERTARLRVDIHAGKKTTAFAGARYRQLESNTAVSGHEAAVFAGLDHTF